ncbi:MAG: hypothetical protein JJ896_07530 [Rhodothermales bacterium]|nr:hypothetical protein [Rhodothermales bacterium]MBO6779489.1 hypothetical protein [Rhodothermales bacterium]
MIASTPKQGTPVDLLQQAQAGDRQARDRLLGWAYVTAHSYYRNKAGAETALSSMEAEDLATAFYFEFARAWPRIHAVYHYTRRSLKNNLHRHLKKSRTRRNRETLCSQAELARRFESRAIEISYYAEEAWSDRDWLRYRVIGRVMASSDQRTRELVQYRCAEPGLSYREIAGRVGASEASLRMRMTRFYDAVRRAHSLALSRSNLSQHS